MMNNDDIHLNKITQQFDYSMQNLNSINQYDDSCMELLDKLTSDDNTSNFIPTTSNANVYPQNNVDSKDDDKFCQEILFALEKKDYNRILSLAISQSNNSHKMECILHETIQEIEKNSDLQMDSKMIEKLYSLLRQQPKTMAATPLRATVAPIRNESIVCSSSSNMSNNTGFRANKPTKSEQEDFLSLISSDCKIPSGTRSLPATPPISQMPNRPLSSHCVPIRSNDTRKPRNECDTDQQAQSQSVPQLQQQQQQQQQQMQQQQTIPLCSYGPPQQQQQQTQMQYLPLNMSPFSQYPSSLMTPNIVLMPMMNGPGGPTGLTSLGTLGDQQGPVTHSMPQSNTVMSQAGQSAQAQNNQISLLLSSAAFFSMGNTPGQQTVTTSHDMSGLIGGGGGSGGGIHMAGGGNGGGSLTSTTSSAAGATRSPAMASSHGSNLPKLLPKPQQPQRQMQYNQQQQQMQMHPVQQQQQQMQHGHLQLQQQQHNQMQQQQQGQQPFKRPSNRKSTTKARNTSSRSNKAVNNNSNCTTASTVARKDGYSTTSMTSNKDNVAVAWEIAEQSGGIIDDHMGPAHPSVTMATASGPTSSSTSFVNDLAGYNDDFTIPPLLHDDDPIALFCTGQPDQHNSGHDFDDLLDDLVSCSGTTVTSIDGDIVLGGDGGDIDLAGGDSGIVGGHNGQSDNWPLPVTAVAMVVEQMHFDTGAARLLAPVTKHRAFITVVSTTAGNVASSTLVTAASRCVVVARQTALATTGLPAVLTRASSSTATAAVNSTSVDSQRVMQLLCEHLDSHSVGLLTPFLKSLLPPSQLQQQQSQSPMQSSLPPVPMESGRSSRNHPLSVCTRLSDQDDQDELEMTEDDLLADISPVKRDPAHLANLDRFLESCQSASPPRGTRGLSNRCGREVAVELDDCEDNDDDNDGDDGYNLDDDKYGNGHGHSHGHRHEHSHGANGNLDKLLPFQALQSGSGFSTGSKDQSMATSLQQLCGKDRAGRALQATSCWLRKSKQRNKWTVNGTTVRTSKVLEVPASANNSMDMDDERQRSSSVTAMLRKKSNYRHAGAGCSNAGGGGGSGSCTTDKTARKRKRDGRDKHATSKTSRLLHKIFHASQSCDTTRPSENASIAAINTNGSTSSTSDGNMACSAPLKVRIRLSELKVVASTLVRSPDPPPPPLVSVAPLSAPFVPVVLLPDKSLEVPVIRLTSPRRTRIKSISAASTGRALATPLAMAAASVAAVAVARQTKKHHGDTNTKRIFCTRKEDRRSSALVPGTSTSPTKQPIRKLSPSKIKSKSKRIKVISENPPLILKLCTKRADPPVVMSSQPSPPVPPLPSPLAVMSVPHQGRDSPLSSDSPCRPPSPMTGIVPSQATAVSGGSGGDGPSTATTGNLKIRLKRSQDAASYTKQEAQLVSIDDFISQDQMMVLNNSYEFSPPAVTLQPPQMRHRPRPQLAALQFSPAHSSSDSDVDVAHNEISSLLQRQEQRDPLSSSVTGHSHGDTGTHQHHQNSFPQLPVPYLVGTDPTVFIDPHEFDLVVVKNSKYKKVAQRDTGGRDLTNGGTTGASGASGGTAGGGSHVDVVSDSANNNELFVPGCFIEQDKSHLAPSWNHSSPSMPVLAPQEPFTANVDNSSKSANHISVPYEYSNQLQIGQQGQSYSDHADRLQQSPLCMTTNTNGGHTSQYSASSQNEMRPDSIKSPYHHQQSYYQQEAYNGSCYLNDNNVAASANQPISSKTQLHSSPVAPLQTTTCSSHIQDYPSYFQNASQIQSLASSDTASFSSISLTSSAYQPIVDHQSSKHNNSKRSSSSRSHASDQTSSKKRRDTTQSSQQLPAYSNNTDIYNAAAAAQYSNLDYYSSGFSDIIGGIDRVKLYEQWTREYSNQLGPFCQTPWNNAMAEYCKQAASLIPQGGSASSSTFGLGNSNPLSLTSNSHGSDYQADISHSVDPLKPLSYLDPYTAYAMTQPYMYSAFGLPK